MNPASPPETHTSVQNTQELYAMRQRSQALEQCILSGISLFAQLLIGMAFYLYDHVSTPGYLSILLGVPFALLLAFFSFSLYRRAPQGCCLLLAGKTGGKWLARLLSLIFLLDAQMAAFAISAILSDVLPHFSPLLTMLAVSLMMAAAIGGEEQYALPRLSRLLRWPLWAALLLCGLAALPHGSLAYLSPPLGRGMDTILQGGLWMSGCLSGACCPLILPGSIKKLSSLPEKRSLFLRPLIVSLLAACLYALLIACTLPFFALARPENLGFRLLLFTKISGSALSWSLLVVSMLFLLLIALAAGVLRAAGLLSWTHGKKHSPPLLTLGLLLLISPAAALKTLPLQQALITVAPFRGAAALLVLLLLWLLSLKHRKIRHPEKEEKP